MLRTLCYALLCMPLLSAPLRAQEKVHLMLSGGASIPVGVFASTSADDQEAGSANPGVFYGLSAGYTLTKHLGVAALFRSGSNPLDTRHLEDDLAVNGTLVKVGGSSYTWNAYMVGGFVRAPLSSTMDFEVRALFGLADVRTPNYNIVYSNKYPPYQSVRTIEAPQHVLGYAGLLGMGLRWNVGKHLCWMWTVDYMASTLEYESSYTNFYGQPTTEMHKQPMGMLNMSVGIGYRFGAAD